MLLGAAATAQASIVTVTKTAGTLQYITDISSSWATGATMAGMQVTTYFADSTNETVTWQATGDFAGAAVGTLHPWSLSHSVVDPIIDPTFNTSWTLTYLTADAPGIIEIFIDAGALTETDTNAVAFDLFYDWSDEGTANSGLGGNAFYPEEDPGGAWQDQYDFFAPDGSYSLAVAFSGIVALESEAPVGDLYRYMDIAFAEGPFAPGSSLPFYIDTDNVVGTFNSVPLPSTLVLLGTGLAGLLGRKKTRLISAIFCAWDKGGVHNKTESQNGTLTRREKNSMGQNVPFTPQGSYSSGLNRIRQSATEQPLPAACTIRGLMSSSAMAG